MPSPKHPCPDCGQPTRATRCRSCPAPYERTDAHRAKMTAALKGRPHNWRSGSTQTNVARKIQKWWTPERKEAKRLEMLQRNPNSRYHGLSARAAKRLTVAAGKCSRCPWTKRLDIHHKDRDKRNQSPENLEVLCHRCHMQEHRHEIGWAAYHRNRR